MRIFDAHCDVLYKMWMDKKISFKDSEKLHINLNYLSENMENNVQCFALYVPDHVNFVHRFDVCLEMIDIFYEKIIKQYEKVKLITRKEDIELLQDNEIGAILTLEGCDAIGRDITKLRTLYRLGVTSIGLTWNYANLVADGALEDRKAGLTNFGKEVVKENNRARVWTDVSHLSEQSFWDTIELAQFPIASHSNAYSLWNHPRNLNDNQIKAMINKNGMIGVTFVPNFIGDQASIGQLVHHIDHICSLGGEFNVGLGSDFDGIDETVPNLNHYGQYQQLIEELLKYYSHDQVKRICFDNFASHYPK